MSEDVPVLIDRPFVGAALLAAGRGGIARVARLMVKSLADQDLRVLSLLDETLPSVGEKFWPTASGSYLRFVAGVGAAIASRRHFVYDSAGIARAHPSIFGLRRPYATWIHGIDVWEGLRPSRRRAIDNANLVLVNSTYTLERFQRLHGDLPKAQVCWLATEEDEAPATPPDFSGPPTLLMLSRIEQGETYKGHDHVVAAWPAVAARVSDARLVIVGAGTGFDHVRELAEASPAADRIEMTGFVTEAEVAAYWRAATAFCMPSTCEGFGLVYAEAMRHGLPVIASIHDAGNEVNVDGITGFNIDLNRPGELTDRLITLLGDRDRAREMGQAGFRRWREHFSYSAFLARFRNILANWAGENRRSHSVHRQVQQVIS